MTRLLRQTPISSFARQKQAIYIARLHEGANHRSRDLLPSNNLQNSLQYDSHSRRSKTTTMQVNVRLSRRRYFAQSEVAQLLKGGAENIVNSSPQLRQYTAARDCPNELTVSNRV
jgi:hypothetical protein